MNIHQALNSEGYICDVNLASAVEACLCTRPTAGAFLYGPAGSGKTYLPETLGKILKREVFFFQCFPGTREDDLLVKLIPDDKKKSGIAAYDGVIVRAAKASQKKSVLLVLDEWDKTRPSADSFLLDFLQSGRINFNGRSCQARQENMTIFITLNDEREISEPLLRRLPLIQFNYPPASLIRDALMLTHAGHPYLSSAVMLYERCIVAGMPKPATIQELRQLLDAITVLGERADWDSLVFQFVTKTRENHIMLKKAEKIEISSQHNGRDDAALDPQAYCPTPAVEVSPTPQPITPKMPTLAELRGITSVSEDTPEQLPEGVTVSYDGSDISGILELSDNTYDAVVGIAGEPSDDPCRLGDVARVVGREIVLKQPIRLENIEDLLRMWGHEGSVVVTLPPMSYQDVLKLRKIGWKAVKYSTQEIIVKTASIDLRWTPHEIEVVVNLKKGRDDCERMLKHLRLILLRGIVKNLPTIEGCKTHGDYYKKCGIPQLMWDNWHPDDSNFSPECSGWELFLKDIGR